MKKPIACIALTACLLVLAGCDKSPSDLPAPVVEAPVPAGSGATATSGANMSVPPAESVFPPAGSPLAKPEPEETDGTRKPAQEPDATAKPMPGQNNDHSAPLSNKQ